MKNPEQMYLQHPDVRKRAIDCCHKNCFAEGVSFPYIPA